MPVSRALNTPLSLALLALVAEGPRHPYDMMSTLRERRVDELVRMRGGSLYDAIARLVKAGLVSECGVGQTGSRPEHTVYSITPPGEMRLRELVTEFLGTPVNEYPRFPAALAHILVMAPGEAAALLRGRAQHLETLAAQSERELRTAPDALPRVVTLEIEYLQRMRKCESEWLREVAAEIDSGQITWLKPAASETSDQRSTNENEQ
ncbi:PadR family transcriptional regulator [Hoyosella altamirensis]|uniref:DNA-binding PadR family transcriptional regulator n=1 Tax=Hoyosella altamirensis TaxID=616997 RepID=A0A839RTL3_9ACTN|nr:PadR family transcriptional regulator [Hoyosella altamirensis]MBB3039687.1 DNA-binding PadR family transcriptional regulator [Hoyosella altamirensis]